MKRSLSLALAVLMLLTLLVGCAAEPTATPSTDTPAATDAPAATTPDEPTDAPADEPTDTPADEPADAPAQEVAEGQLGTIVYGSYSVPNFPITDAIKGTGGLQLPLVDEPTELSVFRQYSSTFLSSPAELLSQQEFVEKTGVTIDWQTYTEADQFSIFIASGLYTDMIFCNNNTYTGGIDKAIDEEIYVAANDYSEYTPNYNALRACDHSIDIQCKTDTGNYFFAAIQTGNEPPWCGPFVRTDWLVDCGLDTPLTYDDWYEMLVAFRDQKGSTGMLPANKGYDATGFGLISGYDTIAGFYAKDGVEARYGFLDEGMRDYVAMMAQWYAEGLINPDFVSLNPFTDSTGLYTSDACGAFEFNSYSAKASMEQAYAGDADQLDAVPFPARTEDQQGKLHFRRYNYIVGNACTFITTGAVERGNDVLAAQWIDFQYSELGFQISNYGKEGVSYEIGEDGYPHFTDFVLKPSGEHADKTVSNMSDICRDRGKGGFYSWLHAYDLYEPEVVAAYDIWSNSATGDWVMPAVTKSTEESETYTAVYGDIQTYADEMILRFITGEVPMTEWDGFVAEIEAMDVQTAIDAYQSALNRYNAR